MPDLSQAFFFADSRVTEKILRVTKKFRTQQEDSRVTNEIRV